MMNTARLIHQRLFNQQIIQTSFTEPHRLVTWFGAMQAQEYAMANWAISLRLTQLSDATQFFIDLNKTQQQLLKTAIKKYKAFTDNSIMHYNG